MKRAVCSAIILVLLLTILFPISSANGEENNLEIITSGQYGKGYRYNIQGWVYIHIEGEPYERGYQYGYLASAEIVDTMRRWSNIGWGLNLKGVKLFILKNILKDYEKFSEQWWKICKSESMDRFLKYVPEEYQQEMRGMVDGIKARGGKIHGHDIEFEDVLAAQFVQDVWYTCFKYPKKGFHPLRDLKYILSGRQHQGHCFAFIATGDATADGGIVVSQATVFERVVAERCNIILDVEPSEGYRFIMTSPPGSIWSQEDYYQNERGIILTETELPQGPWKKNAVPKGVRSRTAIQYSDSIDEVIKNLNNGNNGLIPNEWLIGDTKTGEIASLEQALYNTPVKRTKNGFYWSCCVPHDPKVKRELYDAKDYLINFVSKLFPKKFGNPFVKTFEDIEKEYYGKIDIETAKNFMSIDPFTRYETDVKITDSKLMKNLGLWTFFGNPNGSQWNLPDKYKERFRDTTEHPASGWVEIFTLDSDPKYMQSTGTTSYKEKNSKLLWQYETDDTRNIFYSSSLVDEDVVYTVTSSGTLYALDSDNGRQIWSKKIGEKSVDLEISDDLIFIGSDEGLSAVFKDSGKIKWEKSIGEISSKPSIVNNQIIAGTVHGDLYGFDLNTGEEKWTDNFDDAVYISEAKGDTIFLGSGDTCYAYNINKQEIIWRPHTMRPITASPKVNGDTVYVGSWDGYICALDSETGIKKWCYETGWGIDSTPYVKDGTVFVGSLDNNFYALDEENGDLKWVFTCKSAIHSNPIAYGEYVFFGCDDGRFYALDKTSGDLAWSFAPGYTINDVNNYITTPILSNPVVENGVVYIGAKGNIYALDAQTVETCDGDQENDTDTIDALNIAPFILLLFLGIALLLWVYFKKR